MLFFQIPGLNIIAASPQSGKTTLIKFELFKAAQLKKYDYSIIFTNSTDNNWEEIVSPDFIYYTYDEKNLAQILKFQRDHPEAKLLLIFDDMIGSINFESKLFTILATQFRHFRAGIGVVIATQYIYKIPPTLREVCSTCIIFRQKTKRSIDACFESFGSDFENKKKFHEYLQSNIKDYHFVVVNNKVPEKERYQVKKIDISTIPKNTDISFE